MTKARDLANGGFGLVLIKPSSVVGGTDNGKGTVSFSAASSVSLNDVFSTTYDNYKILFTNSNTSGSDVYIRVRVSGADLTSNSYANIRNITSIGGSITSYTNYADTVVNLGGNLTTQNSYSVEISNPFATKRTQIYSLGTADSSSSMNQEIVNASVKNTTSYTGFTLISSLGNMTGTVSVYGFNK